MRIYITFLVLILALGSCKNSSKSEKSQTPIAEETSVAFQESPVKGKKLMETKCYVCHGPDAGEDARIAPPMAAIKARYLMEDPSKEAFANAIWNFVEKPTFEKGKMKGAMERFGVMPYQPYSKEEIRLISEFIYDYKIEEPTWFKEHWEKGHGNGNYRQKGKVYNGKDGRPTKDPKQIGLEIANETQKVLGKNLMGKIQNEGPVAALAFCNENAYPLTDSMSIVHGSKIKRVSDLPRNPLNTANSQEIEHINYYKEKVGNNEAYEPILVDNGKTTNFYYPIVANSMCLKCHGKLHDDIGTDVVSALRNKYPQDKAVGYSVNEVRGIWSIVLENE